MADRPTQEWLKPDQNAGPDSLPLPTADRPTLAQSRAGNRAGESAGYPTGNSAFYQIGPLTAQQPGIASSDLIGGRHPQRAGLDTEDVGGVDVSKPRPGARRQLINPDDTKPIQYPGGF